MRSRVPPRERRGYLDFPPQDLLTSFETWQAEVGTTLRSWPELLTQFQSEPIRGFSIGLDRATEPHWSEIEHRTDVLTAIVKELEGHT